MTNPIEYYSVSFKAGQLGLNVDGRQAGTLNLGNTVVDRLTKKSGYPGQAERNGVRVGDVIVAVNGHYTAFESMERTIQLLQTTSRPLNVCLCRPSPTGWMNTFSNHGALIKSGILQKQAGWLNKLKPREFKLTRSVFSYFADGVLRKRISVADIIRVKSESLDPPELKVITSEKELILTANNYDDKIRWLHALQCAKNHSFDDKLHITTGISTTNHRQFSHNNNNNNNSSNTNNFNRPQNTPETDLRGPYKKLKHCRVSINLGGGDSSNKNFGNNSNQWLNGLPKFDDRENSVKIYDFSLEKSIMKEEE